MIPYRKVRIIIRDNYCLILPLCIIMLLCSTHVYYNFEDTGIQRSQIQDMQLSIDRSKQQVVVSPQGSLSQGLTEKHLHDTSEGAEPKHSLSNDKVSDKVTDKVPDKVPVKVPDKVTDKVSDKVSDKVADRQNERRKLIEETCAKHSSVMNRQASSSWKLKLNTRDRYLLCPIPKSGWSSWKRLWHFTAGLISSYATDVGNGADTAAGVKDVTANRLSTEWRKKSYTYSFVFFRNPWDRLVSAYINKAVEYNYSRILHTPCRWESMKPYKKEPLTFKQFLTCIADGSNDMHWTPQWKLCNVCGTKYDFIGHLDTVEEDAKKVIADIGLNVTYPHSFASKMKKTNAEWYKNVPADLLKRLQSRYQFDFELHGWSPQPPGRSDVG